MSWRSVSQQALELLINTDDTQSVLSDDDHNDNEDNDDFNNGYGEQMVKSNKLNAKYYWEHKKSDNDPTDPGW